MREPRPSRQLDRGRVVSRTFAPYEPTTSTALTDERSLGELRAVAAIVGAAQAYVLRRREVSYAASSLTVDSDVFARALHNESESLYAILDAVRAFESVRT